MTIIDQKGIALLITMILLGTIMATALSVAVLVAGETGITRLVNDSTLALFAADAGSEKMFYACSNKIPYPSPANFNPENDSNASLANGAKYTVCMAAVSGGDCTNTCNDAWVISKGSYNTAQRSFEASY